MQVYGVGLVDREQGASVVLEHIITTIDRSLPRALLSLQRRNHSFVSRDIPTYIVQYSQHSILNMFFLYNLTRQVTLHPSYFGRDMHELVTSKLLKDVEGTCTGQYYIITIMDTFDISEGRILPGSGLAEFTVGYRAVVWRPFKGETVSKFMRQISAYVLLTKIRSMRSSRQSTVLASSRMLDLSKHLCHRM